MIRRNDWQSRLQQFLLEQQNTPFAYGAFDCCLFVADAIEAMTGTDLAERFRGRYRSREEAYQALQEATGTASLTIAIETLAAQHGLPEEPVLCAQRGDLVLLPRPRDASVGLVDLNGRDCVVLTRRGLWRISMLEAERAWQI